MHLPLLIFRGEASDELAAHHQFYRKIRKTLFGYLENGIDWFGECPSENPVLFAAAEEFTRALVRVVREEAPGLRCGEAFGDPRKPLWLYLARIDPPEVADHFCPASCVLNLSDL